VILRLLAVERGIRGVLVLLAAWGVYHFRDAASRVASSTPGRGIPILKQAADVFHIKLDLENSSIVHTIREVLKAEASTITWGRGRPRRLRHPPARRGHRPVAAEALGEYSPCRHLARLPIEIFELTEKVTWSGSSPC